MKETLLPKIKERKLVQKCVSILESHVHCPHCRSSSTKGEQSTISQWIRFFFFLIKFNFFLKNLLSSWFQRVLSLYFKIELLWRGKKKATMSRDTVHPLQSDSEAERLCREEKNSKVFDTFIGENCSIIAGVVTATTATTTALLWQHHCVSLPNDWKFNVPLCRHFKLVIATRKRWILNKTQTISR